MVHSALRVARAEDVVPHRAAYRRLIEALRDDRVDLDRAAAAEDLNLELDAVLAPREVA